MTGPTTPTDSGGTQAAPQPAVEPGLSETRKEIQPDPVLDVDAFRGRFLRQTARALLAVAIFLLALSLFAGRFLFFALPVLLLIAASCLATELLLRRGRNTLAALVLIMSTGVLIAGNNLLVGDRGGNLVYLVLAIAAGFVFGRWGFYIVAVWGAAILLAGVLADHYRLLPPNQPQTLLIRWVAFCIATFVLAGPIAYAAASLIAALQAAGKELTERRKAEAALRESEVKFRAVVENSHDGIVFADAEGVILYGSPSLRLVYGYARGEWTGHPAFELIHPDEVAAARAAWAEVLRRPDILHEAHFRIRHEDGTWRWVHLFVRNLLGNPDVQAVVLTIRDITESKQAQIALETSEQRYRAFVANSTEGIWRYEGAAPVPTSLPEQEQIARFFRDAYLAECNDALARMYGYERAGEMISRRLPEMAGADPRNVEYLREFIRSGYRLADVESFSLDRHGRVREFVNSYLGVVENGCLVRVWGVQRDITESKAAERALAASELRYRTLFEAANDAVFLHRVRPDGAPGEFVAVNNVAIQRLGYSAEEFKRLAPADIDAAEHAEVRRRAVAAIRSQGQATFEIVHRAKDGRLIPVEISSRQFVLEGEPLVLSIARDISERKRAETELRESQQQLRESTERMLTISNCIPDAIFSVDLSGRYTFVSANIERLMGWTPEEAVKLTFRDTATPEQVARYESIIAAELEKAKSPDYDRNTVLTFEAEQLRRDGTTFWAEVSVSFIWDQDGRPIGVTGVARDITERRRAQEALRESEERFRSLSNASLEGIMIHDRGVILDANLAFARLAGYDSPEELIGRRGPEMMMTEESRARIYQRIERQESGPTEVECVRKDGSTFAGETESRPIRYMDRDARIVAMRDITRQKRAEAEQLKLREQLAQAQKMESIGRLAGGVAHDFNNLLTVINGYSELVLARLKPEDPLRHPLEEIHRAGERAAGLTRQLLAFSRKQILQPRELDLNRVVGDMLVMLRRLVGERVQVSCALCAQSPVVRADPHQLEQVILNLAVNARDAMPGGGRLTLETALADWDAEDASSVEARPGAYAVLALSDTGAGMDQTVLERIFEPFFTTKGPGEGTGLGMSIVQGIVAQSSGFIRVSSEPGQGSTFRIYLPAAIPGAAGGGEPAARLELRGTETVLVVEDQEEVRNYAVEALNAFGYRALAAQNAAEALGHCQRTPIDLVLTDVVMPHTNGREVVARLEQLRPGIRALFMSGYANDVILQHGVVEQGTHFIQKPFSPEALAAKVRAILGPAINAGPGAQH